MHTSETKNIFKRHKYASPKSDIKDQIFMEPQPLTIRKF